MIDGDHDIIPGLLDTDNQFGIVLIAAGVPGRGEQTSKYLSQTNLVGPHEHLVRNVLRNLQKEVLAQRRMPVEYVYRRFVHGDHFMKAGQHQRDVVLRRAQLLTQVLSRDQARRSPSEVEAEMREMARLAVSTCALMAETGAVISCPTDEETSPTSARFLLIASWSLTCSS